MAGHKQKIYHLQVEIKYIIQAESKKYIQMDIGKNINKIKKTIVY